ncbi:glyceraldehyde-3-phosphate dehydrogenase-like protein [Fragilariopsis cylindrus CCMP1102]|uniref:homoserine dehydrogenase n=1 Tax=Fragilariopsis cylindrus CCMP1102 TaxID=635003 RepID=A0A1E7EYB2_9STRA|nr:glyceraldehyde-3-phosphate dehydrogenase-like protein [Fragilariopsis cylindrus CCMP1102]|eukprot:OEU10523.1 glyceraldehyde-3-phosphate dehydrogenase-like protein [Fragilariopsis cylindrus CCMP1102]
MSTIVTATTTKVQTIKTRKLKVIKTAILGMGSVNRNLLKIIADKKERLAEEYGIVFEIIAVTDSTGIAIKGYDNDSGFDITELVNHKENGGSVSNLSSFEIGSFDSKEAVISILNHLDVDLLFEATPCCVSVVLANKGPLIQAIDELLESSASPSSSEEEKVGQARRNQGRAGRLEYSATVCGGLPILNIGKRDMIVGNITKIQGVFNATSNFIIDAMANGSDGSKGITFQEAIQIAKDVGAAEADPSLDTDGWDTAFKLLIIVNTIILKGTNSIKLSDITVEGIDSITPEMIQIEAERGNSIKLVATADIDNEDENNNKYSVRPISQPINSFLGSINGWEMGIEIHSDIYGISYHKLYEKEPIPTAASMLRDAVHIFGSPQ